MEPQGGKPKKEIKFTFKECLVVDPNFDDIRGQPLEAVRIYVSDAGSYELYIHTSLDSDHSSVNINQHSGPEFPRDEFSTGFYGVGSFGSVETKRLLNSGLTQGQFSLADYSGKDRQEQTGKGTLKKAG